MGLYKVQEQGNDENMHSSFLMFLYHDFSVVRYVVLLCFHSCLVSILFTGPILHVVKSCRNFLPLAHSIGLIDLHKSRNVCMVAKLENPGIRMYLKGTDYQQHGCTH